MNTCIVYFVCFLVSFIPHFTGFNEYILIKDFNELDMEFPRKRQSCNCHQNVSAQTNCQVCSKLNQDLCGLCGSPLPSVSLSNEMQIGDYLPDNICQCFLPTCTEADVPEEINVVSEQNAEAPIIEIHDSQNISTVKEESYADEYNQIIKKDVSREGHELMTPECRRSSSAGVSSPDDSSPHRHLPHNKKSTSPSSGEDLKHSSSTEKHTSSSGYALSLCERSSDRNMNFTSPSSDGASKSDSNTEKEISSGYALSVDEQSPDRWFRDRMSITSPSSGGDSRKSFNARKNSLQSLIKNKAKSEHNKRSKHGRSDRSPTDREHMYGQQTKGEESNNLSESNRKLNSSKNGQFGGSISTEIDKFRFENPNIRLSTPRPQFPRPFPHPHQQHPTMQMSVPRPYPQPFHTHPNPMPLLRTNIPGRFSVASRPQHGALPQQQPDTERSCILSRKVLAEVEKNDSEGNVIKPDKRIEDWLENVSDSVPDETSNSGIASNATTENERLSPNFPETSTDEQSSTEISEEENRRQRSSRQPPRNFKKRPK